MHIPDGFLSPPVWIALGGVSAAAVGVAARKVNLDVDDTRLPFLGALGAFVFAAQMVNVPVAAGTSGHLSGAALLAAIAGPWAAILVMAAILVIQALLFQDGGITALGANIFNMAVIPSLIVSAVLITVRSVSGRSASRRLAIAAASFLAVEVGALAAAFELALSGRAPLLPALAAMGGVHLPIGAFEALITVAIISYLRRLRTDSYYLEGLEVQ